MLGNKKSKLKIIACEVPIKARDNVRLQFLSEMLQK